MAAATNRHDGVTAAPQPLTASACAYLAELDAAAELVQHRRAQAQLAERGRWLMEPTGIRRRGLHGPGAALNPPLRHVDNYQHDRLYAESVAARRDVGRVAWWFTTAALAALDAVLAGQEISGRRLEELTLARPGRDQEVDDGADPWAPCFRPHLPGEGELRTGDDGLDAAMDKALAPLLGAYTAAGIVEDYDDRQQDEPDDEPDGDDEPGGLADWEASALHDAEQRASGIPDLLIAYARTVVSAAHAAPRIRRT